MSIGVRAERADRSMADGIKGARARWNLSAPALYEEAVRRGEGLIAARRAARLPDRAAHRAVAERQVHRPRAVERSATIAWGGVNRPMSRGALRARFGTTSSRSLEGAELFVQDCCRGRRPAVPPADPRHHRVRLAQPVRAQPVHRRPAGGAMRARPSSRSSMRPASRPIRRATGSDSDVVIALNFAERLVLIGGTSYAGEIKKSIFTHPELPAAAAAACCRCTARRTSAPPATWRCSSGCPAPARRRSRAIPSGV